MSQEHTCIALFTKYPTEGRVKTRLIPAFGAQLATKIHNFLAKCTVATLRQAVSKNSKFDLHVFYDGADLASMQAWLGNGISYHKQHGNDLGDRLLNATNTLFAEGYPRIIFVGADCCSLNAQQIMDADLLLETSDIVIGPCKDGGYYLIGIKKAVPEIFNGISWGSEQVFSQTITIAKQLGRNYSLLPMLSDIDRPEDVYGCAELQNVIER